MSRLSIDIADQQPHAGDDEQALSGLRQLLEQRLADANRGEAVTKSVTEIAAQVLGPGGHA